LKLLNLSRRRVTLLIVLIALAMRWLYATWAVADFWGDAYHHWLISRLTLAHNWRYTDYKGLETIWLPGYHYLVSLVMILSGRLDLGPAHMVNIILGTVACGLTTWLTTDFSGKLLVGFIAGLALALTPWHIAYSVINMPEVLMGVLLLLTVLAAYRERTVGLGALAFAGALTRHELTLALIITAVWLVGRRRVRPAVGLGVGLGLALVLWSSWSWWGTGDPLLWWTRYQALAFWDARFWRSESSLLSDLRALWRSALDAWPLLPWLAALALVSVKRRTPSAEGVLLAALVGAHGGFLAGGFVAGHLPTANPRYLLGILPVWVILLVKGTRWYRETIVIVGFIAARALWVQLPELRAAPYIIAPELGGCAHDNLLQRFIARTFLFFGAVAATLGTEVSRFTGSRSGGCSGA
jgi:hypothetical protein